jgi:ankyrin repeat protein
VKGRRPWGAAGQPAGTLLRLLPCCCRPTPAGDKAQLLLDAGAAPDAQNKQGSTALHLAAINGHVGVVKVLLAKGANAAVPNKEGKAAAELAKSEEIRAVLAAAQQL